MSESTPTGAQTVNKGFEGNAASAVSEVNKTIDAALEKAKAAVDARTPAESTPVQPVDVHGTVDAELSKRNLTAAEPSVSRPASETPAARIDVNAAVDAALAAKGLEAAPAGTVSSQPATEAVQPLDVHGAIDAALKEKGLEPKPAAPVKKQVEATGPIDVNATFDAALAKARAAVDARTPVAPTPVKPVDVHGTVDAALAAKGLQPVK